MCSTHMYTITDKSFVINKTSAVVHRSITAPVSEKLCTLNISTITCFHVMNVKCFNLRFPPPLSLRNTQGFSLLRLDLSSLSLTL